MCIFYLLVSRNGMQATLRLMYCKAASGPQPLWLPEKWKGFDW